MSKETNAPSADADWRPDVFEYLDYRAFLNEWRLRAKKARVGSRYTYTVFARKAGLRSRGHMHQIFEGAKGLTEDKALQIGRWLFQYIHEPARRRAAEEYLVLICRSVQAGGSVAFEALKTALSLRREHRLSLVQPEADPEALVYLGSWWIMPLRQLTRLRDFEPSARWIRTRTWMPVTDEALTADLQQAQRRGDLVQGADGRWAPGPRNIVSLGHDLGRYSQQVRLAAGQLHRDALDVVKASIEAVDRDARHLNLKFVAVSKRRFGEFRERLQALIEQFADDEEPDTVYQLHFSLVPLTRSES